MLSDGDLQSSKKQVEVNSQESKSRPQTRLWSKYPSGVVLVLGARARVGKELKTPGLSSVPTGWLLTPAGLNWSSVKMNPKAISFPSQGNIILGGFLKWSLCSN